MGVVEDVARGARSTREAPVEVDAFGEVRTCFIFGTFVDVEALGLVTPAKPIGAACACIVAKRVGAIVARVREAFIDIETGDSLRVEDGALGTVAFTREATKGVDTGEEGRVAGLEDTLVDVGAAVGAVWVSPIGTGALALIASVEIDTRRSVQARGGQ